MSRWGDSIAVHEFYVYTGQTPPRREPKYPDNTCPVCGGPQLGVHYHESEDE